MSFLQHAWQQNTFNHWRSMRSHRQAGLSLIELLIVIAIISILIATLAPLAIQKRIQANEASAIGGLKAILAGSINFYNVATPKRYPRDLEELGRNDPKHVDANLAKGLKSGYVYDMNASTGTDAFFFSAEAHPFVYRRMGVRSFYIDDTGILLGEDIGGFPGRADMKIWD